MKRLVLMIVCLGMTAMVHAQQIRIRVLDAHNGKPVSQECLNISLGTWHGADLFAPTDKDGIAHLSFSKESASAEPVAGSKACGGMVSAKNFLATEAPKSIAILPNYNVSCQYSREQTKNPAWLHNPLYQGIIPSLQLQDILADGIVAANTCSNFKPAPSPGELILLVRKVTFLEGMRS